MMFDHDLGPFCGNPENIPHVQSAKECTDGLFFDERACACIELAKCKKLCPPGQRLNPFELCECIDDSDFNAIYDHGLGPNCGR